MNTKASSVENKFLALLNYLAIFELGIGVIEIFQNPDEILYGVIRIILAVAFVIFSLVIYKTREKKL